MKKRTRNVIITACVGAVVAAAVLVGVFVGKPMVERQQVEQEFAGYQASRAEQESKGMYVWPQITSNPYEEGVPVADMDESILNAMTPAVDAMGYAQPENAHFMALPEDLHYYSSPDASGEPALTLKKGTVVALYGQELGVPGNEIGYGCVCYPDYQKGWRYGQAFIETEGADAMSVDAFYDKLESQPSYYVETTALERVLAEYYDLHRDDITYLKSEFKSKGEFVHNTVRIMDHSLMESGLFCSPDLP